MLVILARIALVYAVVWALQESTAFVISQATATPYAWMWPSPWNCPQGNYLWGLPRCTHWERSTTNVVTERDR